MRVLYLYDMILYRVYMKARALHVDRRDCDVIINGWIPKTAHTLPIPDPQESDLVLERTAVPCLHDIEMSFRTRMKISLRYSYLGELAPI